LAAARAAASIGATLFFAVIALSMLVIWQLRAGAIEAASAIIEDQASSLAAHASQVFSAGSYLLNGIEQYVANAGTTSPEDFARRFASPAEAELLRARAEGFQPISIIALTDRDGQLIAYSGALRAPRIDLSDRESFRRAQAGRPGVTYVSAPVQNRVDGQWTIYLSRRLESSSGTFIGVALAGLPCRFFSDLYTELRLDHRQPKPEVTSMTLLRQDRTILARAPFVPESLGARLPELQSAQTPLSSSDFLPWDARPENAGHAIVVSKPVSGFPVQVAVAAHERLYLETWRRQAAVVLTFALVAGVLLMATFTILVRVLYRREHLLQRSQRLQREAEAANRIKSEFLAVVSHEIRTPMNGMLGTADLLVRAPLRQPEHDLALTLLRAGRNLLAIINDILDFSKMEAGELIIENSPYAPAKVIQDLHDLYAEHAGAKGLSLTVAIEDDAPAAVFGDVNRVRQVLENLLSNAIKFSDVGSIRLRLKVHADHCPPILRFEIDDSGIGIPPEARDRLFQAFAQLDASSARRYGGTGLGLAISQRLVTLMRGRIDFDSTPGEGTRFWVDLPLEVASPSDLPAAPIEWPLERWAAHAGTMALCHADPDGSGVPHKHVLVVEDNPVNAVVVEAQLTKLGCSTETATDGEEALALLRQRPFDLVLMDCMLPGMSGFEVTSQWRREETSQNRPRVPIVALTANALASNAEEARRSGMDDFLTKPCTLDKLAAALTKWLPIAGDLRSETCARVSGTG